MPPFESEATSVPASFSETLRNCTSIPLSLGRAGRNRLRNMASAAQGYVDAWSSRKLSILFSKKDDWEPNIRWDFRHSRHRLYFGDFTNQDLGRYDLLVPLTVADTLYLNQHRLASKNPIPMPTRESLSLCDDKYIFSQTLLENGFGRFIPKISDNVPFPYILKKKVDEWGANSHIIGNKEQERPFAHLLSDPAYFRQELIPGKEEYTTHILFARGRIVCALNIEYIFEREFFVKGKNEKPISIRKSEQSPFLSLFSSILDLIGFEGLCCVNYKIIDQRPMIFEINPRFGASLSSHFSRFVKCLT